MAKKGFIANLSGMMVLGLTSTALAADGAAQAAGLWTFFGIAIACGVGIGLAAMGTGIGMGNAINGLQDPGPWADVQRYPEKLWRLMMEYLLGGFPPAQSSSVKKSLRSIAIRRSQWLSHGAILSMISHPDRAAL